MQLANEFKLLVIVGAWNRSIFSGEWIKKYLLPKDDFSIEISLDNFHRVLSENIIIEFQANRLNFIPITKDNETYQLISDLSVKIADYLPHTPVRGYGINFLFEFNSEEIQNSLIRISDVDKLGECGVTILNSMYKHTVIFNKVQMNITISTNKDKLNFDFNFHTDIKNLTQFKDRIYEYPIDRLYNMALGIMNDVYMLQPDGE